MHQLANKLLFLTLAGMSSSLFSAVLTPIEIILEPNTPTVLSNPTSTRLAMRCEVHVASNTNNLTIKIISGNGVFNGTTFREGDSMVWTIYNMQQVSFTANPGTKARVTYSGSYTLRAVCM
ncbi:hypothetical protein [Legionella longbeachae]|uniref:Uncharacterized protein n=1 Tax=Legionella longbeachae serogroup 1 (strain NSW150) TaxID=661367 RepID=D3HPE4_LEGLN|nr:hypothetical protein [Legionella longbeachae]VEE01284.1 Uncharacterised protein [Legionella oakridgensis]HBD7398280.1 hypothetical protein [Legionella pneumophila]ARB92351.1 hypothetical protein A6J40_09265 [Legionella longbeachae]ARM34468.1 hypothetical protein B0B39_13455 [Legionella longbeachae]EEZ96241.1 conserved hypothetical protein [Legionella longbeachae D-4968]